VLGVVDKRERGAEVPNSSRLTDIKWCQPKLTVRVKHLAGSKTLRHATVKRLVQ
jgi:hypothetical protein